MNFEILDGLVLVHFYGEASMRFSRFRQYLGCLANIIRILHEIETAQELLHEMELHKNHNDLIQLDRSMG